VGPIELIDLTVGYGRHPAVHHLAGAFPPGSLTAVVGPNGAGKSTLLKALAGLMRPMGGRIGLDGLSPRDLAYLPQQAEVDRQFPITVRDFASLGLWRRVGAFGGITPALWDRVAGALGAVGLAGLEARAIGSLSGGQFQRLLFARVLLQDAPAILLDEPFAAIDARTTTDLMALVREWSGQGRTVVAVMHDLDLVRRAFPLALVLARRVVAWGPVPEALAPANLEAARGMAQGWNEDAPVCAGEGA
jgi:zinc/manganese transport system ATP-binding protein